MTFQKINDRLMLITRINCFKEEHDDRNVIIETQWKAVNGNMESDWQYVPSINCIPAQQNNFILSDFIYNIKNFETELGLIKHASQHAQE